MCLVLLGVLPCLGTLKELAVKTSRGQETPAALEFPSSLLCFFERQSSAYRASGSSKYDPLAWWADRQYQAFMLDWNVATNGNTGFKYQAEYRVTMQMR